MNAASGDPVSRAPATKITDLTGPGHTDAFGIGGTDLGATTTAPDGRLVSVFGDTFASPRAGGRGWRSPVVLFGDPSSVPTGVRWTGSAGRGPRARQVVRYLHQFPRWYARRPRRVTTVLPTDVLTVGDTMYLHVMVCRELGHVHWTEIHSSRDQGVTWRPTGVRWPGGHLGGMFQMLTWERGDDGWVYAFTTGFQRAHGLVLHRVPADRVTTPGAWQSWRFTPGRGWAWDRDGGSGAPTVALPGAYGELSLRRVQDRWLLSVFDAGNYRIDVLDLASPLDDLHTARRVTVLDGCGWEHEDHAAGRVAQLYGGYVLPGSRLDDLHLVVSQWNTARNWPYRAMQFRTDLTA